MQPQKSLKRQEKGRRKKIQSQLKSQNKMARCLNCKIKVCTRKAGFYPDLGGYLCSDCEQNEEFIILRQQEVEQIMLEAETKE